MSFVETGTILDRILARTAADVEQRKAAADLEDLERLAQARPRPVSLGLALSAPGISVIAEFKRASPSKGRFPFDASPGEVARQYLSGGASAMSVLTDEPFFQGTLADMSEVAEVLHHRERPAPVLRKDFVLDPFQILEARANGADAILLIVAALEQGALVNLLGDAKRLGLEVLVEVHDAEEMRRAADAGAAIIGINNRDLHTFHVDLATTEALAPLAPLGSILVAESGIFSADDARRMASAGAHAILVGESVVVAADRVGAVRQLATAMAFA